MTILSINTHTEKYLIEHAIKGDRDCCRQLYNRHAPLMMTICRRYAKHNQEAEDLLQDGFIKVFKNLHQFKFNGSFEGWVRRIMVNTALKAVSKKSYKQEIVGIEEYQHESIEAEILSKLNEEEILKLINQMAEGYKVVFNMYVIEGYSHKEIAEQLNVEESTSRSQLVKARRWLQEKILSNSKLAV